MSARPDNKTLERSRQLGLEAAAVSAGPNVFRCTMRIGRPEPRPSIAALERQPPTLAAARSAEGSSIWMALEKPPKNLGYAAGADVQAFAAGHGGLSTNVVEMSLRELLGTVEAFIPMPAW